MLLAAFSSLGAIGFGEGELPFVPITISVVMALGYDRMAGAATAFLGLAIGWTSGLLNILSTGICHQMFGLPLFSGLGVRALGLLIFYVICFIYLRGYCNKLKKNPERSLTAEEYRTQNVEYKEENVVEFTLARKVLLLLFVVVLVLQAVGAVKLGWALPEIASLYVMYSILAVIIGRLNPNNACVEFTKGACQLMVVCIMIGLANAVILIMQQGMIIDTAVQAMAGLLEGKSPIITLLLVYLAITVFNFFIVSGPGKAVILMPILSPLASLLNINQQVITLTFCYADGLTNYLYPTSGAMLAGMMLAGLDYPKWLKFYAPLCVLLMVVAFIIILAANDVLIFTAGMVLLQSGAGKSARIDLSQFINPCFIGSVLSIVLFLLQIELTDVIGRPVELLADATAPIAMSVLGYQLAGLKLRDFSKDVKTYVAVFFKLMIAPLCALILVSLFPSQLDVLDKTLVIDMCMPVAVMAVLLSQKYGLNTDYATKSVLISTVGLLASVPLFAMLAAL